MFIVHMEMFFQGKVIYNLITVYYYYKKFNIFNKSQSSTYAFSN